LAFLFSILFLFMSEGEHLEIELTGDLAGIPALTAGSKKLVSHRDGLRATLVAGRRNWLNLLLGVTCQILQPTGSRPMKPRRASPEFLQVA